jgi:hypothetical protein
VSRLPDAGAQAVERIDDAGEADERVLVHLARLGCDTSRPRESTHYLYFAFPSSAEDVASRLRADGWTAAVSRSEGAWLIVATHLSLLTSDGVQATRRELETLSAEHGGLYDGWEAPV